jgi:hypothetical protein
VRKESWPGGSKEVAQTKSWSDHMPGQRLLLTQAIRPAQALDHGLREGYRVEIYRDAELDVRVPVITAALSADKLLPIFLDLLPPLGNVVDFILESSHAAAPEREGASPAPMTWEREAIDLPVLTSTLYDFEELLLNDGCTGVAVLNVARELEVHFDEHKLIYLYGPKLGVFESILQDHGIRREDDLILLTESEHIHCTLDEYLDKFNELRQAIGIEDEVESTSW